MSCRDPTPETPECHYCQQRRWCQPSPRMTESPPRICLTFPETIIFLVNIVEGRDLIENLALQYVWGDFKNIKYGFWLYNGRDVAQMIYVILPEKRWPFADCLMVKSSSRPIDFFSQFDLTILIFSLCSVQVHAADRWWLEQDKKCSHAYLEDYPYYVLSGKTLCVYLILWSLVKFK